ncbi:ras GTPase-activating protein raskol-like [Vespula maculifrons]|uniref:Ras GTPase-activating protein raskol-like n=1 Tax=Vespula maculifrons TaxID=7453 RepID=A0ABD2BTT4_VESMC
MGDAMFVELPRVRLDGGARAFRQHWGYESRPLAPPPPLIEEDEAAVEPETVSLREANTASPIGERVLVDLSVTSKTIYSVIVVSSFVAVIHKTPDTIIARALSEAPDMPSPEEPS